MTGAPSHDRYEVAVVGGGPAGAVAALVLSRRGRRVALIEASRYDGWRLGETLYPSIREPLSALGLADTFEAVAAVSSNGIRSCWGESRPRAHSFLTSPYGSGWHVDRTALDRALGTAADRSGATTFLGTRVTACEFDSVDLPVTLSLDRSPNDREADGGLAKFESASSDPPDSVSATGVIDATGRTATVGRWLTGEREVQDRLVGAAALFRADHEDCGRYALVEATPDGWWYSAPLPDDQLVVMWVTDADLLGECRGREPWLAALSTSTETSDRTPNATFERGPTVAAALSHRLQFGSDRARWLPVGDAAMAVDPLSGRGVSRAIDTGVRGALAMDRWLDGDRSGVDTYERNLDDEFAAYLDRWHDHYALEDRWPDKPFWRRRHASASAES